MMLSGIHTLNSGIKSALASSIPAIRALISVNSQNSSKYGVSSGIPSIGSYIPVSSGINPIAVVPTESLKFAFWVCKHAYKYQTVGGVPRQVDSAIYMLGLDYNGNTVKSVDVEPIIREIITQQNTSWYDPQGYNQVAQYWVNPDWWAENKNSEYYGGVLGPVYAGIDYKNAFSLFSVNQGYGGPVDPPNIHVRSIKVDKDHNVWFLLSIGWHPAYTSSNNDPHSTTNYARYGQIMANWNYSSAYPVYYGEYESPGNWCSGYGAVSNRYRRGFPQFRQFLVCLFAETDYKTWDYKAFIPNTTLANLGVGRNKIISTPLAFDLDEYGNVYLSYGSFFGQEGYASGSGGYYTDGISVNNLSYCYCKNSTEKAITVTSGHDSGRIYHAALNSYTATSGRNAVYTTGATIFSRSSGINRWRHSWTFTYPGVMTAVEKHSIDSSNYLHMSVNCIGNHCINRAMVKLNLNLTRPVPVQDADTGTWTWHGPHVHRIADDEIPGHTSWKYEYSLNTAMCLSTCDMIEFQCYFGSGGTTDAAAKTMDRHTWHQHIDYWPIVNASDKNFRNQLKPTTFTPCHITGYDSAAVKDKYPAIVFLYCIHGCSNYWSGNPAYPQTPVERIIFAETVETAAIHNTAYPFTKPPAANLTTGNKLKGIMVASQPFIPYKLSSNYFHTHGRAGGIGIVKSSVENGDQVLTAVYDFKYETVAITGINWDTIDACQIRTTGYGSNLTSTPYPYRPYSYKQNPGGTETGGITSGYGAESAYLDPASSYDPDDYQPSAQEKVFQYDSSYDPSISGITTATIIQKRDYLKNGVQDYNYGCFCDAMDANGLCGFIVPIYTFGCSGESLVTDKTRKRLYLAVGANSTERLWEQTDPDATKTTWWLNTIPWGTPSAPELTIQPCKDLAWVDLPNDHIQKIKGWSSSGAITIVEKMQGFAFDTPFSMHRKSPRFTDSMS